MEHEPYYYPIFAFYHNTGTRMGEAVGLLWSKVRWDNNTVLLDMAVRKGRVGNMKHQQIRKIQLKPAVMKMLQAHHRQQIKDGTHDSQGRVFPSRKGGWMPQSTLDNVNRRISRKAGLPYLNIHGTRHTFATTAIENGVDLPTVGGYLGHHDLRITQTIYSHLVVRGIDDDRMPAEMGDRKKTDKVIPIRR